MPCRLHVQTFFLLWQSRQQELNGLLTRGVFTPVPASAATSHHIFGFSFENTVKNQGVSYEFMKFRLVVQAFNDKDHGLLTHAPTVQRMSLYWLLLKSVLYPFLSFSTCDVSETYVKSETVVQRPIFVCFVWPAANLTSNGMSFFVSRPSQSWRSLVSYLPSSSETAPAFKSSTIHPCFLYTLLGMSDDFDSYKVARGLACLQKDGTANVGSHLILNEDKTSKSFDCMPTHILSNAKPVTFNGAIISRDSSTVWLSHVSHIKNVSTVSSMPIEKQSFIAEHACRAYIAAVSRPNLSFGFSICSQYVNPNVEAVNCLNKFIHHAITTVDSGFSFIPLDLKRSSLPF